MKTWPLLVVALILPVVAGCRVDPHITLLERQNRMLEDEIYRLRAQLDSCGGSSQFGDMPTVAMPQGAAPARAKPRGGTSDALPPDAMPPDAMRAPAIVMPDFSEAVEQLEPPDTLRINGADTPLRDPPLPGPLPEPLPDREQLDEAPPYPQGGAAEPGDVDQQAAGGSPSQISYRGYDADGEPGDEGITIVLQPRDAQGRLIRQPGKVSIVVLDPLMVGEAARVARWDFSAEETAKRFSADGGKAGIHLQARWPAAPPLHDKLHVFVRYTAADGRRFEADGPVEVALAGEPAPRWVPTDLPVQVGPMQPRVRIPHRPTPQVATRPAEPKTRRPTWSPNRS